jgi:hypothetical protein
MSRERKTVVGPEKLAILRRHLAEKVPTSDLCDQQGLQPSQVSRWQAQLFEDGANIFERKPGPHASAESAKDRKIAQLELDLVHKNEVIFELMEERSAKKNAMRSSKRKLGSP